jgi:hypothetical protein
MSIYTIPTAIKIISTPSQPASQEVVTVILKDTLEVVLALLALKVVR